MRGKLGWALLAIGVLIAVAPALAQDRNVPVISDIRQENGPRSTRLVVDSSGPLAYTYYSPDPLTLVIDLPDVDASKLPSRITVGTREVETVRVTTLGRADGRSIARLEVRLASLVPYQIYSKDRSLNMVFERSGAVAESTPSASDPTPSETTRAASLGSPSSVGPIDRKPLEAPVERKPDDSRVAQALEAPIAVAPAVAAPTVSKPTARKGPATRILGVARTREDGRLAITVSADGSLQYQDFYLGNPDRLVVDFRDVLSRALPRPLDVNQGPVKKVRLAQFSTASPRIARLVVDLASRSPYRIVEGTDGVKIVFGEGEAPTRVPLAALKADPDSSTDPTTSAPSVPAPVPPLPVPVLPEPQAEPTPSVIDSKMVGQAEKKYTGDPITLDFKEGDILDIFRLFSEISGLNVVVNPGVSGKVTLKLNQVPWDQALDLILKANGLGYTRDENVIRIAPLSVLQKEEDDRRKLKEQQDLAGELVSWRRVLSYGKAEEVGNVLLKAALSARGSVIFDKRSNMMLVTDLPDRIEKAKELTAELDRAVRQVEIEARIVVTNRNFSRDIGIQWGFMNQMVQSYGNNTNLSFPNAIILNGTGVPSDKGLAPDTMGLASANGIGVAARGYAVNLPAAAYNSAIGITMGNILGNFNIDAALTALETQGRGRFLSTPKITTQNNREAEIKQGVQIPIQVLANNTVTVMFKDAVLTLKVTPQITDAGTVILDIDLKNDLPDWSRQVQGIPPINTQAAKTQVLVKDGSTTVIGGIYQGTEQTNRANTPILGDIPLLGYLFRNRSIKTENNELLLFITPRIVKG